eukprot:10988215-Prorocentrum_lima.AAC.1
MFPASSSCSSSTAFRRSTTKPRRERECDPVDPSRRQARHCSRSSRQIHSKQERSFPSFCR